MSDQKHRILIVDDIEENLILLETQLADQGYVTNTANNGIEALKQAISNLPDLLMLDVNMPGLSGLDVCAQLKNHPTAKDIPIILVTAESATEDIVQGFEIGADDYLIKPYNRMEMLARVRSMLRIKDSQLQLKLLNDKLDEINQSLEQRVKDQVEELSRVNRLRRFFSPQIVNTIISSDGEDKLKEHRGEITVVFLDLRNFTSFAELNQPEIVLKAVRDFHAIVGPIIFKFGGTLERFTGDGLMVFLGDPEPMPDHPTQAIKMAIDIQNAMDDLHQKWADHQQNMGLGIGIATGTASMGSIGFEGRQDYAAIGTVTNLSARLCSIAKSSQILIAESTKLKADLDDIDVELVGETRLKGFSQQHSIYNICY